MKGWALIFLAVLEFGSGQAAEAETGYRISGTFALPAQKVEGFVEVFGKGAGKQWLQVEIPNHGKHLRVVDGATMWHFDPPPGSRTGEGVWAIYPRPGYDYAQIEKQRRLHEVFDVVNLAALAQATNQANQGRSRIASVDPVSKELRSVKYAEGVVETFLLERYKDFGGVRIPTQIMRLEGDRTNDVFTIQSFGFTNVADSKFAMPLRVRIWPEPWNEFDEAYPPPTFVKATWPWKGEHSRYFHPDFGETNKTFYWSYVVFNALEGDTLKTAEELRDALHRYDAALYGKGFPPEKIKVTVGDGVVEEKLGHAVTRRAVQIDGFDAEAARKPLTTYLQVYRWHCPVADRTGMLVLRSPRVFSPDEDPWKTLLGFWVEAECHHSAR